MSGVATKTGGGFSTWPSTWLSQLKTNVSPRRHGGVMQPPKVFENNAGKTRQLIQLKFDTACVHLFYIYPENFMFESGQVTEL